MSDFEDDIEKKRTPDAGLREAKAALAVVEKIYAKKAALP
jgi:hypothetical protein